MKIPMDKKNIRIGKRGQRLDTDRAVLMSAKLTHLNCRVETYEERVVDYFEKFHPD
jgi:hypothetical protein